MTYSVEELQEKGTLDEEAAKVVSQLIAWHGGRVDTLKETMNTKVIRLQGGEGEEDITIDDPQVITGYQLGIQTALMMVGELPIRLSE